MQHDLAARLLAALHPWNEVALASVLTRDVRLVVDSGDETGGEAYGRACVVRTLHERLSRHPDATILPAHVNGRPGLALRRPDDEVVGVLAIDGSEAIETLWVSTAPRKLAPWNRRRPAID
ncbi:hypothetical protein [Agromyces sp. Leaf222]|uniref:hypothetical protein n=1 Tax=Agromyces sp. Leaf222 TaxID=1735688 RepID=UPI0006FC7345|nr:hypothetical protein [Agromyces sp. Leaf222]KQM82575.1 hypothetical protein ASE68_04165 [Agromyces sp. Leaf222]